MSCNESSPEGNKKLLVPKRKRGVTWKAKPRRAERNFFIVTSSARTAPRPTEADIFEDLVRKSLQVVDIVSPLPPASKLVRLNASVVNGSQEASGVPLDQSVRHQQLVPALQKLQPDDTAKALHNTDKREKRLSAYQGIESSEHHECVSMELTCSSSMKSSEDMVTPAVVHVLESKAHHVDMSRVRYFLDQLACGGKPCSAVRNPSGHSLGEKETVLEGEGRSVTINVPASHVSRPSPHERSLQNTSTQESSHERKGLANEKQGGIPEAPAASEMLLISPECGSYPLQQGKDLPTLQLPNNCNGKLNGAGKQPDGILDSGVPEEKLDGAICKKHGVELDGTDHAKEAVPNGFEGQQNNSTLCQPMISDTSIETLRDRDTDEVAVNDYKVAFTFQDSSDESVDECLRAMKSCHKENTRYAKVGGSNSTATKKVGGTNHTATKEGGGASRIVSEAMKRGNRTFIKELALSTSFNSSTSGKKKLSLSRKRNTISSAVCNTLRTLNATGRSIATRLGCPGDNIHGKDTSLVEHFSTLQLTPILPLPLPSSPQQGKPGPLASTPISTPNIGLSHTISATPISRQLPHTNTSDKSSTDESFGSTMEKLLDFDEVGFDASTSISQTPSKGPEPTQSCLGQQAPLTAAQDNLTLNTKVYQEERHGAMHTSAKKHVLVRTPGLVKAAKPSKLHVVMQRDGGSPGTTPPSCVLIRLHEGADKDRKKVHYHPCAFKDAPEDILVTIVNRDRRLQ